MLLLKATAEPLFGKLMTTKKRLTEMSLHEKWDYFALFASNPGEVSTNEVYLMKSSLYYQCTKRSYQIYLLKDDDDDEEDDEDE
jgi:hypothetical protein